MLRGTADLPARVLTAKCELVEARRLTSEATKALAQDQPDEMYAGARFAIAIKHALCAVGGLVGDQKLDLRWTLMSLRLSCWVQSPLRVSEAQMGDWAVEAHCGNDKALKAMAVAAGIFGGVNIMDAWVKANRWASQRIVEAEDLDHGRAGGSTGQQLPLK